jgi:hypothetical protein
MDRLDAPGEFVEKTTQRMRRLLRSPLERPIWAQLASRHARLLDDQVSRGLLRKLFNDDHAAWVQLADVIPRLRQDPAFSSGAKKTT